MKKFYTFISALALCALSASAAITVTLEDGTPVANGETLTVTRDQYSLQQMGPFDRYTGKVDVYVEGANYVKLSSATDKIQFCPTGIGCITLFDVDGVFAGERELPSYKIEVPVDVNYMMKVGEPLPQEKHELKADFSDAAGEQFVVNFVFDSNEDSGVEAIGVEGKFTVYTIAGVRVLEGADAVAVKALPAGLYIVNGKKVVVK